MAAMESPPRAATRLQRALFEPIGEQGRAEQVEKRLLHAITGGHIRPGDRLPSEQDLAQTFGVSTVTVREALRGMRAHGVIETRRGRGGGSFVAPSADPLATARASLESTSRLALRDLGHHYAAISIACVRLAVRRATEEEIRHVRERLDRLSAVTDAVRWRQVFDDVLIEVMSLSQSARLTREHMKLQVELSPFVRLLDPDAAARTELAHRLAELLQALEAGDAEAAARCAETGAERLIADILTLKGNAVTTPIPVQPGTRRGSE